ncbi:PLAC8 family protein [Prunus dulcis]|uniref:PLAC8 family protein n=1 Tax=Prunus dulcis TaxID=3755 RepID=A0A4Y1R205_PRUDU|nr:PLAC8 family protein [Prunus dulcis]
MASLASAQASSRLDALSLTNTIVSLARNARTDRHNCGQLAEHVGMIGNLLEKIKSTDLMKLPATKEPLVGLEEALEKALQLVESCRDKSCLYMLAMGWSVVYQFRQVQAEIDLHLSLLVLPMISLLHEFRLQNLKEGLQAIEEDQRMYTLEEEDMEAQNVVLKPDRTRTDAEILEKSLSPKYPNLTSVRHFRRRREAEHELQRSRTINDAPINVDGVLPGKKVEKLLVNEPSYVVSGYITNAKSIYGDHGLRPENEGRFGWQADLFGCCSEPCLNLLFDYREVLAMTSSLTSCAAAVPWFKNDENLNSETSKVAEEQI